MDRRVRPAQARLGAADPWRRRRPRSPPCGPSSATPRCRSPARCSGGLLHAGDDRADSVPLLFELVLPAVGEPSAGVSAWPTNCAVPSPTGRGEAHGRPMKRSAALTRSPRPPRRAGGGAAAAAGGRGRPRCGRRAVAAFWHPPGCGISPSRRSCFPALPAREAGWGEQIARMRAEHEGCARWPTRWSRVGDRLAAHDPHAPQRPCAVRGARAVRPGWRPAWPRRARRPDRHRRGHGPSAPASVSSRSAGGPPASGRDPGPPARGPRTTARGRRPWGSRTSGRGPRGRAARAVAARE